MKNLMMATAAILCLSACDVMYPDEPADELGYKQATAMLRACPPIARIVRETLSDTKLTIGELHRIGKAYGTAYGRRARAEMRAEAMTEAGMKTNVPMPPKCSRDDPRSNSDILTETWASWGFEHGG
jgi:hypothetical protein